MRICTLRAVYYSYLAHVSQMKITLRTISDSDKHFASASQEYEKRLWKQLTIVSLKPVKHGSPQQIIDKETTILTERLQKDTSHKLLLHRDGSLLTTQGRVELIQQHPHCSFVIGGPYGVNETALRPRIDGMISLGYHTMPHGLAKLVLLEQLYRVQMILDGRTYHY